MLGYCAQPCKNRTWIEIGDHLGGNPPLQGCQHTTDQTVGVRHRACDHRYQGHGLSELGNIGGQFPFYVVPGPCDGFGVARGAGAELNQLSAFGAGRLRFPANDFGRDFLELLAKQQVGAARALGQGSGRSIGGAGMNGQHTGAKGFQPEAQGQPVGGVLQADRKSATGRLLKFRALLQALDYLVAVRLRVRHVVDIEQRCSHGNLL